MYQIKAMQPAMFSIYYKILSVERGRGREIHKAARISVFFNCMERDDQFNAVALNVFINCRVCLRAEL